MIPFSRHNSELVTHRIVYWTASARKYWFESIEVRTMRPMEEHSATLTISFSVFWATCVSVFFYFYCLSHHHPLAQVRAACVIATNVRRKKLGFYSIRESARKTTTNNTMETVKWKSARAFLSDYATLAQHTNWYLFVFYEIKIGVLAVVWRICMQESETIFELIKFFAHDLT